jgi:alkylation response protein AidB-like acyl-CoA dehydrogenase
MDADDLELFRRSIRHATESHTGSELDAALDELGWRDALAADPRVSVSVLFEMQGEANATSSALDRVLGTLLGVGAGAAIVLPAPGRWDPPGRVEDDRIRVRGLGTATLARQHAAVVVAAARAEGGGELRVLQVADVPQRSVHGADPSLGLVAVEGEVSPDPLGTVLPVETWTSAVAVAQLAIGHELVGAARRMLELARVHALERIQFGRPISSFQAVRHRLAETLVAIEMADAALSGAWDDGSPTAAAMAKAVAGRAARTAARHCQQVLAGIGFTTEHPFHRYQRRVLVLDQLFGSARSLTKDLGESIVASRRLPYLLPL